MVRARGWFMERRDVEVVVGARLLQGQPGPQSGPRIAAAGGLEGWKPAQTGGAG